MVVHLCAYLNTLHFIYQALYLLVCPSQVIYMSGREGSKPVKVKIIETKYVQTDATQFKSVVQQLTGKDPVNVTELKGSRSLDKNKKTVERSTGGHDGREDVWVQQDNEKMVVDASTSVTLDEFFKFLHD